MNELIGRKFKRNKYGLSIWTDTIREVSIQYELLIPVSDKHNLPEYLSKIKQHRKFGMIPHIKINRIYDLDEIVIMPHT